jgi:hypothetical protein
LNIFESCPHTLVLDSCDTTQHGTTQHRTATQLPRHRKHGDGKDNNTRQRHNDTTRRQDDKTRNARQQDNHDHNEHHDDTRQACTGQRAALQTMGRHIDIYIRHRALEARSGVLECTSGSVDPGLFDYKGAPGVPAECGGMPKIIPHIYL